MEEKEAAREENVCDKTFLFFFCSAGPELRALAIILPWSCSHQGTVLSGANSTMTVNGGVSSPCSWPDVVSWDLNLSRARTPDFSFLINSRNPGFV